METTLQTWKKKPCEFGSFHVRRALSNFYGKNYEIWWEPNSHNVFQIFIETNSEWLRTEVYNFKTEFRHRLFLKLSATRASQNGSSRSFDSVSRTWSQIATQADSPCVRTERAQHRNVSLCKESIHRSQRYQVCNAGSVDQDALVWDTVIANSASQF